MRRRAERCASIIGAKQKRHEPPASHAPVTDVALSPSRKLRHLTGVGWSEVPAGDDLRCT
jgi:hypothetical protein